MDTMQINGETWVKESSRPTGSRAVVVVDRGWIFAGDVERRDGRIYLTRAVWVFRWTGGQGFAAMVANPKKDVDVRRIADVDFPAASEIFCVAVAADWGL